MKNLREQIKSELLGKKRKLENLHFIPWLLIAVGVIPIIPILFHDKVFFIGDKFLKLSSYSSIGSYLGGTTGILWALAGIVFIYLSFLSQSISLDIQQLQLLDSEESVLTQKEELKEQNKINTIQRFETTFFNLISQRNSMFNDYTTGNKSGAQMFRDDISDFVTVINKTVDTIVVDNIIVEKKISLNYSNYVSHIVNIILYVKEYNSLNDIDKSRYYKILGGILTRNELEFLRIITKCSIFVKSSRDTILYFLEFHSNINETTPN